MSARLIIALDVSEVEYPRGTDHDSLLVAHDVLGDHPEIDGFTLVTARWMTPDEARDGDLRSGRST